MEKLIQSLKGESPRPNVKLENYDSFTLTEIENDYYRFIYTSEEFERDLYDWRLMKQSFYDGWAEDYEYVDWLCFKMGMGFTDEGFPIEMYDDGTYEIIYTEITPIDTFKRITNQNRN